MLSLSSTILTEIYQGLSEKEMYLFTHTVHKSLRQSFYLHRDSRFTQRLRRSGAMSLTGVSSETLRTITPAVVRRLIHHVRYQSTIPVGTIFVCRAGGRVPILPSLDYTIYLTYLKASEEDQRQWRMIRETSSRDLLFYRLHKETDKSYLWTPVRAIVSDQVNDGKEWRYFFPDLTPCPVVIHRRNVLYLRKKSVKYEEEGEKRGTGQTVNQITHQDRGYWKINPRTLVRYECSIMSFSNQLHIRRMGKSWHQPTEKENTPLEKKEETEEKEEKERG